jgi:ubiquitin carboxyl-terminal hydrolase 14
VNPMVFLATFQRAYPQFAQRGVHGGMAQQDAEECCSQFLNSMAQRLTVSGATPSNRIGSNVVDRLFGMEMETVYTNTETEAEPPQVRTETARKLSCHISVKTNFMLDGILDSLDEVVTKRSELLGRETSYKKSSRVSKLPQYALVHFVRFFWKQDTQTRAKVLRPVNFPVVFDIMNLCTESLKTKLRLRRDKLRAAEDAAAGIGSSNSSSNSSTSGEAMAVDSDNNGDIDTGLYELVGVVTHIGRAADSGHYIGWAKHNNKWLCFNDDVVSEVTEEDIIKLSGSGGSDWHIAYMCLYRQKATVTK